MAEELFDLVDERGDRTGATAPRSIVHADGLGHRAVHIWLSCPATGEILLQRRAACKDSWPRRWDISCAGHLSAGDSSRVAAERELQEELGLSFAPARFEYLMTHHEHLSSIQRGRKFTNNEFNDVFLIEVSKEERACLDPARLLQPRTVDVDTAPEVLRFSLQKEEVSEVAWFPWQRVRDMYADACTAVVELPGGRSELISAATATTPTHNSASTKDDNMIVPLSGWAHYAGVFDIIAARCRH